MAVPSCDNGKGFEAGVCPTGEHLNDFRQCGFMGCVDLRQWAKANRYRYRLEESYKAEDSQHVKGDGRWFVEILCQNGLIYPKGGDILLAYAKSGVKERIRALGDDIRHHQTDGNAEVFKFPLDRLDEVAAILKPRRRKTISPEHLEALRNGLRASSTGGANQSTTAAMPAKTSEEG
jgi:hypothetical protein